jgi:hypothetical protein
MDPAEGELDVMTDRTTAQTAGGLFIAATLAGVVAVALERPGARRR